MGNFNKFVYLLKVHKTIPFNSQKILIVSAVFVIVALFSAPMTYFLNPVFPNTEITRGRKALYKANQEQAGIYAPELMSEAETYWAEMLREWHGENKKPVFLRDYSKVNLMAMKVTLCAQRAVITARDQKVSLQKSVGSELIIVRDMIQEIKERYSGTNLNLFFNEDLISCELQLFECESVYERDDYFKASAMIRQIKYRLMQSNQDMSRRLNEYYSLTPVWDSWAYKTIQKSTEDSLVAILIDKQNGICRVFENRELIFECNIELGLNWIGHKKVFGDNATPEGFYRVTEKKEGKNTDYYLALEIDYPNRLDVENFKLSSISGEIPAGAQPGGLIELHGGGGDGKNWTDGCIAFSNDDMEVIYTLSEIGTPITIVGALSAKFTLNNINQH